MKLVLILMVKNESKILERCLKAVENVVDAFCIHDTGSTDTTCEIAREFLKTHEGCLTVSQWENFGTNRSLSFQKSQMYVTAVLGWNPADTYGLLLDADMMFVPGTLRDQSLTEQGYTIVQCGGTLEYPNCRLVRFDYPWKCLGVTHEYWNGPTTALSKSVCYIDDRNDGGCKADKFERDVRLLEQGLKDDPTNVRYMFYLAQTYHSLGKWKDSISMYKKRIEGGGWFEEIWYSHYMIADSYKMLNDPIRFEAWSLRAYAYRPQRAEALYKLVKYFRENAQQYKAYQYLELGAAIPSSTDSLFIEKDVYMNLFDYERSILDYYVKSDKREGLRSSMKYLLKANQYQQNVLSNLKFYVQPIAPVESHKLPQPFGKEFQPTVVSIHKYPYANVRYVNYYVEDGNFLTRDNVPVQTYNAYINLQSGEVVKLMKDESVGIPTVRNHINGLEDLRLYDNQFTATVHNYSDKVQILQGTYNTETGTFDDCELLPSPHNRECEKNWLGIPGTKDMIYNWYPFEVIGNNPVQYTVPLFFQLLRGSSTPVKYKDEWWVLTHMVEYSHPRNYYHCMVVLDKNYKPTRVSHPFVFRGVGIEYCICFRFLDTLIECYPTQNEKNPGICKFPISALEWFSV